MCVPRPSPASRPHPRPHCTAPFTGSRLPADVAFQATPLQTFWGSVVGVIGIFEFFSIASFDGEEGGWVIADTFKDGTPRIGGDFMFDPLRLKPKDSEALVKMQTKEINNGRLAMIGIAGMVAQELVSGGKLFS